MIPEEKFSENPLENIKIENDFLKLKLKAQYGDAFFMESNADLPPEMENLFLKNIIAFEKNSEKAEYITVYEKIGKPTYKPAGGMNPVEITAALKKITALMEQQGVCLDICQGPYPDDIIYTFITEELFSQEIQKEILPGGAWHFIYEEFHPNDKRDIEKNTHEFLLHWFSRDFNEFCSGLAYEILTADDRRLSRDAVLKKMNLFFDAFETFMNDGYNIDEIHFEFPDPEHGLGHAEGRLKYDAVMENGEVLHYEGTYKLYMQRRDNFWTIFYFVMPGFVW